MEHEIVSQLNDAAKILWDGSIRYTIVNAWCGLLGWSIVGLAVAWGVKWAWRVTTDKCDEELVLMARVICVVLAGIGLLVSLIGLCESIVALIEPIRATVKRLR